MRRVLYYSPANKGRPRNSQIVSTCICHASKKESYISNNFVHLFLGIIDLSPKTPDTCMFGTCLGVVANQIPQMGMHTEILNLCHISPMPKNER